MTDSIFSAVPFTSNRDVGSLSEVPKKQAKTDQEQRQRKNFENPPGFDSLGVVGSSLRA